MLPVRTGLRPVCRGSAPWQGIRPGTPYSHLRSGVLPVSGHFRSLTKMAQGLEMSQAVLFGRSLCYLYFSHTLLMFSKKSEASR